MLRIAVSTVPNELPSLVALAFDSRKIYTALSHIDPASGVRRFMYLTYEWYLCSATDGHVGCFWYFAGDRMLDNRDAATRGRGQRFPCLDD
jgi:hypothetical protein